MEEIRAKIAVVGERVRRLSGFSVPSFESYLSDIKTRDAVERNIEVAIQGCIDIGKIIIKKDGLREPGDNKSVFTVLAENGIISEESLKFLIPMAGTQNVLVHGYDKIDDSIIFEIIKKRLNDFQMFIEEIEERYLKEK